MTDNSDVLRERENNRESRERIVAALACLHVAVFRFKWDTIPLEYDIANLHGLRDNTLPRFHR